MSNLIERLRHAADCQWKDVVDDCQEAADEIERLRTIIAVYEKSFQGEIYAENELLRDQLSFMTEECKRFEAALEAIVVYHKAGGTQVITCSRIVREALNEDV